MSRWRPEFLRRSNFVAVGVDRTQAAWADDAAAGVAAIESPSLDEAWSRAGSGSTVHLIASSELAVHWVQQAPDAVASPAELRQVTATRCAQLFGGNPADWCVAADWKARGPFSCAALPSAVVDRFDALLKAKNMHARWWTTWSVAASAMASRFPDEGWCCLHSGRRAVLWHCTSGEADVISTLALDAQSGVEGAIDHVRRQLKVEAARGGFESATALHWASLVDSPDVLPADVRPVDMGWTPAATGIEAQAALRMRHLVRGLAR